MEIKDPQKLPREKYWKAYADFCYLRDLERDHWVNIIKTAIGEAFGTISD